jgi:hypothetical protein
MYVCMYVCMHACLCLGCVGLSRFCIWRYGLRVVFEGLGLLWLVFWGWAVCVYAWVFVFWGWAVCVYTWLGLLRSYWFVLWGWIVCVHTWSDLFVFIMVCTLGLDCLCLCLGGCAVGLAVFWLRFAL